MMRLSFIIFACVSALPVSAQNYSAPKPAPVTPARTNGPLCPWLSQGTAANALGGDVRIAVTAASASEGTCSFTRLQVPQDELRIFVASANAPSCPAGSSKVNAIGTRAVHCRVRDSQGELKEMISGAVREKPFAVILTAKAFAATKASYKNSETLEMLAEQVAGSLF